MVGGGAVGIEMAGEVAGKHANKFVTVIGAGKHLVTMNYGHKFQRKIVSALRDRNINALTGQFTITYLHCYIDSYSWATISFRGFLAADLKTSVEWLNIKMDTLKSVCR